MPSPSLLSLRKAQLRALDALIEGKTPKEAMRLLRHECIRVAEQAYQYERYQDFVHLASLGEPEALIQQVHAAHQDELRCTICCRQVTGFRTKQQLAIYYTLGLCQRCQDKRKPP
jgi:hypothetical protein